MSSYSFFQNRSCPFFPCHNGVAEADFNCLFCYCPLYALGDQCGGAFCYTEVGIKDCSGCTLPHRDDGYEKILAKIGGVIDLAKMKEQSAEIP